jgi:hypothetical protein
MGESDVYDKMVPEAKVVEITSANDAASSVIRFDTAVGEIDIVLANNELSRLISLLLKQSEKVAIGRLKETPAHLREQTAVTASPIRCSHVGVGRGRTEGETSLFVHVGNLRLAFWVGTQTNGRDMQ